MEGGTIFDDELNRETIDWLSQTTDGNVDVKGISGEDTKGNEYCIWNQKKGSCCYIAAKKKTTKTTTYLNCLLQFYGKPILILQVIKLGY